jgi:hypothetical protein
MAATWLWFAMNLVQSNRARLQEKFKGKKYRGKISAVGVLTMVSNPLPLS